MRMNASAIMAALFTVSLITLIAGAQASQASSSKCTVNPPSASISLNPDTIIEGAQSEITVPLTFGSGTCQKGQSSTTTKFTGTVIIAYVQSGSGNSWTGAPDCSFGGNMYKALQNMPQCSQTGNFASPSTRYGYNFSAYEYGTGQWCEDNFTASTCAPGDKSCTPVNPPSTCTNGDTGSCKIIDETSDNFTTENFCPYGDCNQLSSPPQSYDYCVYYKNTTGTITQIAQTQGYGSGLGVQADIPESGTTPGNPSSSQPVSNGNLQMTVNPTSAQLCDYSSPPGTGTPTPSCTPVVVTLKDTSSTPPTCGYPKSNIGCMYIEFSPPTNMNGCINPANFIGGASPLPSCANGAPSGYGGPCLVAGPGTGVTQTSGVLTGDIYVSDLAPNLPNPGPYYNRFCGYEVTSAGSTAMLGGPSNGIDTQFVSDTALSVTLAPVHVCTIGSPVQGTSSPPNTKGTEVNTQICLIYNQLNTIVLILALILIMLGAALYAGSGVLPSSSRGAPQGYAVSMIIGGIIGIAIVVIAPYILQAIAQGVPGGITGYCT